MSDMSSIGRRVRTRRSAREWQRLICEQADSGMGQGEFCRQRGLATSSFRNWKRRLEASASPTEDTIGSAFVELTAREPDTGSDVEVELELGSGVVLRVRRR